MRKLAILTVAVLACAGSPQAQAASIPDRKPLVCHETPLQTGIASVYANLFEGRKTANGERFSQSAFTAAHMTLPFNTLLQVRDPKTGRTVMVRVNDRGPFSKGRILDLSSAARTALGHKSSGLYKVSISRCDGGN